MKEVSDSVFAVLDHGLFFSVAERLARDAKQVIYWTPNTDAFPLPNSSVIGDGFRDQNIERVMDFWPIKDQVDVWCFPDVGMASEQSELESQGRAVWGARTGEAIEMGRVFFKELQAKLGMNVPEYQVFVGLDKLRDFLLEADECYVKISRWRGLIETQHHVNYELSVPWLDALAVKLGPLQDEMAFLVEDPIETVAELGIDTHTVGGRFPGRIVHAKEGKDKCCVSTTMDYGDLDEAFREQHDLLLPWFVEQGYRGPFSSEARRTEGGKWFITDPTTRQATPCGEALLAQMDNFSECVLAAAHGELLEPEYDEGFVLQAMIEHPADEEKWRALMVPDAVSEWVNLYCPMKKNGLYHIVPFWWSSETVGSVLGKGPTLKAAYGHLKENIAALDGQGLVIETASIKDALEEVIEAQYVGVPFADEELPEPAEILED